MPGVRRMRRHRSVFIALCLGLASAAHAGNIPLDEPSKPAPKPSSRQARSRDSIAWKVFTYLPDRLFDLTDVVRMQVRAGPGWALSVRATRLMPVFMGDYKATWIGLPGPRGRPRIPVPVGIDAQRGVGFGPTLVGGDSEGPQYGTGEIGAGVQIYMLGFDVGFDLYELADFFAGIGGADLSHDDF